MEEEEEEGLLNYTPLVAVLYVVYYLTSMRRSTFQYINKKGQNTKSKKHVFVVVLVVLLVLLSFRVRAKERERERAV